MARIPLISNSLKVIQFIHALFSDSKYAAEGIERLLIETYGRNRALTDVPAATSIGGYVGVTLTRTTDGVVFLATNYNNAGNLYSNSGTLTLRVR